MSGQLLELVPVDHREAARSALGAAFGDSSVVGLEPVAGGASGALTYRVQAEGRAHLMRIETRMQSPMRNPHQYACLRIAADAGIAPAVRHLDEAAGVVVMDFLRQRPLLEYPGGPAALARAVAELVGRLQATPAFPELHAFPTVVSRMLGFLRTSGMFAEGLLDEHAAGLERIREAYAWNPSALVSSHNDPNPRNIVFDGERLWLVDWETAYRNDPLTDVAIVVENLAPTPELEATVVEAWLGRAPDDRVRARLQLMRQLTRMYYAALLFGVSARVPRSAPEADLTAPTPAEFGAAVARGDLKSASPEAMWVLGKMCLAGFRAGLRAPGFEGALALAGEGGRSRTVRGRTART
jgi:Ser/Thr protein kinase RdoA (MazF antagonist)